jgi:hypothetical protein
LSRAGPITGLKSKRPLEQETSSKTFRKKKNWTEGQMTEINWDAHGKALSHLYRQHAQLTKMCHKVLPTATMTSGYKSKASSICPTYKAEDKDQDHVMRCADTTKAKWRRHLIGSVQKRCAEMKTLERLTTILTDGSKPWFNNKLPQPADHPTLFHQLIHQQNNIGWRHLFHGRFASKWQQLKNQHLWTN